MATRKKHKKAHRRAGATHHSRTKKRRVSGTTHRRRRKVGANKLHEAVLFGAGLVAGAAVAPFAVQMGNTALGANAATMPAWMVPGAVAATGLVVHSVARGNKLIEGLGAGFGAVGTVMAINETGILNEPGISGTAFSNNSAPGSHAATTSIGCKRSVGNPQRYVTNSVGSSREAMAIGALWSN